MPGGRLEASKVTAADAPLAYPVGSVAVAVTDCFPEVSPFAGVHDQAPLSFAMPVHSGV